MNEKVIIDYTNHKGERRERLIHPKCILFRSTAWHPEDQWVLYAWDYEKDDFRSFVLKDIHSWRPAPEAKKE
jgi:predicted DNA-binding transcriptional regulator YafY